MKFKRIDFSEEVYKGPKGKPAKKTKHTQASRAQRRLRVGQAKVRKGVAEEQAKGKSRTEAHEAVGKKMGKQQSKTISRYERMRKHKSFAGKTGRAVTKGIQGAQKVGSHLSKHKGKYAAGTLAAGAIGAGTALYLKRRAKKRREDPDYVPTDKDKKRAMKKRQRAERKALKKRQKKERRGQ